MSSPFTADGSRAAARGNALTQTIALFVDAYRDINAKKMFWIVMVVSGLVVAIFALLGINERGITLFNLEFNSFYNTNLVTKGEFYKTLYVTWAVKVWLAWIATILAIVSTAGIFPEMLSGGSIDLYLSKPIGRLRLFITKFASALLFVTLQVSAFSLASFLLIGIRGGAWEPGLFMAVPIVVIFYSYLYAVCVLLGVVTRSTVAAMLLTLLIWFCFWAIQQANVTVHLFRVAGEVQQENFVKTIAMHDDRIAAQKKREPTTLTAAAIRNDQFMRDKVISDQAASRSTLEKLRLADRLIADAAAIFPKTEKTIDLLSRKIIEIAHLERPRGGRHGDRRDDQNEVPFALNDPQVQKRFQADQNAQSATFIIGTSLAFEAVVLSLAAWAFCRRDY